MFIKKVIKNSEEYNVGAVSNLGETSTNMYKNSTLYTFMPEKVAPKYYITWSYRNAEGVLIAITDQVTEGDTPVPPVLPETSQSVDTVYSFTGWNPSVVPATEDKTYTAQYATSTRKYSITWNYRNSSGTVVTTTNNVNYGTTPTAPTLPSSSQSASTVYTFTSWDSQITTVTGNKTYTAQYTEAVRKYNITWSYRNSSGTVTTVTNSEEYGATPTAPSLPQTSQSVSTVYTFTGWNSQIVPVTAAKTYTAQYTQTTRNYQITFSYRASDGEWTSSRSNVPYGTVPTEPTLPETCESETTKYTFTDWDTAVVAVTGTKTYTAQYTEQPIGLEDPIIDFLLVGGGGGGGRGRYRGGGGGGGGGILYCEGYTVTENHTVCIGSGGVGAANKCNATYLGGGSSCFGTFVVLGGGGGGGGYSNTVGCAGGNGYSGGGGSGCCKAGGTGCGGCNGGKGSAYAGGGGGGRCSIGCNASSSYGQGKGGCGYCSTISGSEVWYGSGGTGGGCCNCPGICGGGVGGIAKTAGCNATTCGSGGGGGGSTRCNNCCVKGGDGASGVFIARYPKNCPYCLSGGCVYECGDYKIHCFTSSGTLCVQK